MGNSPEEKYNAYKIIEFINKQIKNNKKKRIINFKLASL